ncbi:nucleotidyltransferase domain-containing protein [Candidatus Sumerlaeota bacterium]|nr:nucleotidyltransferase domain-containing protein [Candidatus Sumerlaeota bacterium]
MDKKTHRKQIEEIVRTFLEETQKLIRVKAAYLFGSVLRDNFTEYSDIDIAIVSEDFTGFRYEDRHLLNPLILRINHNIEVHPLRPEEFNESNPFVQEIINTGVRII